MHSTYTRLDLCAYSLAYSLYGYPRFSSRTRSKDLINCIKSTSYFYDVLFKYSGRPLALQIIANAIALLFVFRRNECAKLCTTDVFQLFGEYFHMKISSDESLIRLYACFLLLNYVRIRGRRVSFFQKYIHSLKVTFAKFTRVCVLLLRAKFDVTLEDLLKN